MAQWGKGIKLGDCHLPRPPDPPLPSPLPPRLSGECTDRLEAKASELQGLAGLPSPRSAVITLTHPSPPPQANAQIDWRQRPLSCKASSPAARLSLRTLTPRSPTATLSESPCTGSSSGEWGGREERGGGDSDPFREPLHRLFLR